MGSLTGVLFVDNVPAVRERAVAHLIENGFAAVQAANADSAIKELQSRQIDVVVLDYGVRPIGGLDCLKAIKKIHPEVQVIMTIGIGEIEEATSSIDVGAFGYLVKPIKMDLLSEKAKRAADCKEALRQNNGREAGLVMEVKERTIEAHIVTEVFKQSFLDSVRVLVGLVEVHDQFTGGHSKRVAYIATEIGQKMGLSKRELFNLEIAALLHDIEVLNLSKRLQTAPFDELTEKERELVRMRPEFAQNILAPSEAFKRAGIIIRHHLEHLDGSGFPDGLKEKKIPLSSRILCVANAYDELKMRRQFTKETLISGRARSEFALNKIKKMVGKHFQGDIVSNLEVVVMELVRGKREKIRINIDDLKPGMQISANVLTNDGKSLVPKRKILTLQNIARIRSFQKAGMTENQVMIYKT